MSSDLSELTHLATDWPVALHPWNSEVQPSFYPQDHSCSRPRRKEPGQIFSLNQAYHGSDTQVSDCPGSSGHQEGLGIAHLCHSQRRGLTVRAGSRSQGATSTPGWTHIEQASGGLGTPNCSPWMQCMSLGLREQNPVCWDRCPQGRGGRICCSNWREENPRPAETRVLESEDLSPNAAFSPHWLCGLV